MKHVAEVMRKIIDDKGISYSSISAKTGISVDALSKTFLGKRRMPADEMVLISKATGLNLQYIMEICLAEADKAG